MMRVPPTRRRPASAVVELSVVLPILVTLLLGIWEIGRMVQVKQILDNAAREGARAASTGFQTLSDIDLTVKNYLAAAGLKTDGYTVKVYNLTNNPTPKPTDPSDDPTAAKQLDHLRVDVTLPFNNVKWLFANRLTNVQTLGSSAHWYSMKDQALVVDPSMPSG
jgi:Flp pilus assembly protein TadG